jgi:hypothetical protein
MAMDSRWSFLGPQEGPAADGLILKLNELFQSDPSVKRAYLCQYATATEKPVALCLWAPGSNGQMLSEGIGRIFRSEFASDQYIDIMFLTPQLESRLKRVCEPFFKRSFLSSFLRR